MTWVLGSSVLVAFRPNVGTLYAAKRLAQLRSVIAAAVEAPSAEQQPRTVEPAKHTSPMWETEKRVLTPFRRSLYTIETDLNDGEPAIWPRGDEDGDDLPLAQGRCRRVSHDW